MAKQIDGTEFACLTINADLEAENEKLEKQLAQSRENLTQCEADRRFEQEKKNIAMKRVSELTKQLALTEKALELACLAISKAMCPNGDWEVLKKDFADAYKQQAEKEMSDGI